MFDLDLLKKFKQKGAMFIEYAMVLSFVIVVGVFFISDGGIKNSIASIFGKAGDTLEVAVNGGEKQNKNTLENFMTFASSIHSNSDSISNIVTTNGTGIIRSSDEIAYPANIDGLGNWVLDGSSTGTGKWWVAWTDVDLSTKNSGDKVKVVVYNVSDYSYYVGYAPVKDNMIALNDSGRLSVSSSNGKKSNDINEIKQWYNDLN